MSTLFDSWLQVVQTKFLVKKFPVLDSATIYSISIIHFFVEWTVILKHSESSTIKNNLHDEYTILLWMGQFGPNIAALKWGNFQCLVFTQMHFLMVLLHLNKDAGVSFHLLVQSMIIQFAIKSEIKIYLILAFWLGIYPLL